MWWIRSCNGNQSVLGIWNWKESLSILGFIVYIIHKDTFYQDHFKQWYQIFLNFWQKLSDFTIKVQLFLIVYSIISISRISRVRIIKFVKSQIRVSNLDILRIHEQIVRIENYFDSFVTSLCRIRNRSNQFIYNW